MRSAIIGFSASAISDTCSNSIRVIKTTKQTHSEAVTYPQVLKVCPWQPSPMHKSIMFCLSCTHGISGSQGFIQQLLRLI